MKRIRLRSWVKTVLLFIVIELLFIGFLFYASERFNNIERNECVVYEETGN